MVCKVEKHGVRTGNSFKRWNTKYYRQYRRQAYLIRSHISNIEDPTDYRNDDIVRFEKTSAFGEGNAMTDGVEYSLNKQRRWDLPGILENIILCDEYDEDYGLQLVERHRITRIANCINVCSTKGVYKDNDLEKDRKFKTKTSGGYFQANSVLKRAPLSKRKRRNIRRRIQTEEDDQENTHAMETNKLRYEVHYPSPDVNYLTHNRKSIGMDVPEPVRVSIWYMEIQRQLRKKRGRKPGRYIKESLLCKNDSFDDSEMEEDNVQEADDTECGASDFTVTLGDILKHATMGNKLTGCRLRHGSNTISSSDSNVNAYANGKVVFIQRDEEKEEYTINGKKDVVPEKRRSTKLHPVRVVLVNEDINEKTLLQKFGNDFIECECFPRKFLLNISTHITRLNMFKTYKKTVLTPHTQACIVFVHDIDNEINNMKENVYKVSINANFGENLNSVQIETVFDYMETNVDEIIERTLFFIETLPAEAIVCQNEPCVYTGTGKRSTVDECAKWTTGSYRPDNAFMFDAFLYHVPVVNEINDMGFEIVPRLDSSKEDGSDNLASPKDRLCFICYTALEENNPGTALIFCSHWFCDYCWKEYIETKIDNGALDIQCPEYDCNKVVDPGTVLSLINMRYVIKHAKCCHDNEVERQKSTRWCPNSTCGRVLKRNCDDAKNSHCACGTKVCFECLQPPHWPASCESVKMYYKKMRDTGDISVEPPERRNAFIVRGKHCPSCNRFIEKFRGCPRMFCICQAIFCWGCGQLWSSRAHGTECHKYGLKDNHGTYERQFASTNPFEKKNRQKWYKMALLHRVNQHESRLGTMKSFIKPMAKKLQYCILKADKKGVKITLDFDCQNITFRHEADKSAPFLKNTLDLYAEINHVVENTSVLINSEQLPADTRLVLQHICYRLSSFSGVIYELFSNCETILPNVLLDKLKEARFHSRKFFQSLVRCMRTRNRSNPKQVRNRLNTNENCSF